MRDKKSPYRNHFYNYYYKYFSSILKNHHAWYYFLIIDKHISRFSLSVVTLYVIFASDFKVSIINFSYATSTILLLFLVFVVAYPILKDISFYITYKLTISNILSYHLSTNQYHKKNALRNFQRTYLSLMLHLKRHVKKVDSACISIDEERKQTNKNVDLFSDFTLKLIQKDNFNLFLVCDFLKELDTNIFATKKQLNVTQLKDFSNEINLVVKNFDEALYAETKNHVEEHYSKPSFFEDTLVSVKDGMLAHLLSLLGIIALLDTKYEFLKPFFTIVINHVKVYF